MVHETEVIAPPPRPIVGKLTTLAQVRREMVRVYKEARQGQLETSEGSRLVFMLVAIARLIESGEIERRLEIVEEQLEGIEKASGQN